MPIYSLRQIESMWGDYGDVLISGMWGGVDGVGQLQRTGPFVPPISFPCMGDIVVTNESRRLLESSGLTGFSFRPVTKEHIVRLDWHLWDQTADEPKEYPDGGEPEGYLLDRPHSPEVAALMGDLWSVMPGETVDVERIKVPTLIGVELRPIMSTHDGTDIFRARGYRHTYVNDAARNWLEANFADWVMFEPVTTA